MLCLFAPNIFSDEASKNTYLQREIFQLHREDDISFYREWGGVRSSWLDHPDSGLPSQFFRDCEPTAGADWASQCAKWLVTTFTNELANGFTMGCMDFHEDKLHCTCSENCLG
jgi:hypothetical protein